MAFELPPGSHVIPPQDQLWCRLYKETGKIAGLIPGVDLIRADQAKRAVFFARVVTVGPGKMVDVAEDGSAIRLPMLFKPGDDVLFGRFHGEPVEVGGQEFIVLKQEDILLKVEIPEAVQGVFYVPAGSGEGNTGLEEARIIV